jgi:hypothetical protein
MCSAVITHTPEELADIARAERHPVCVAIKVNEEHIVEICDLSELD